MKWQLIFLRLHFGNGLELLLIALATQGLCKKGKVTTSEGDDQ
jgi:hypothetical protein